jgi:hypothetical protein
MPCHGPYSPDGKADLSRIHRTIPAPVQRRSRAARSAARKAHLRPAWQNRDAVSRYVTARLLDENWVWAAITSLISIHKYLLVKISLISNITGNI